MGRRARSLGLICLGAAFGAFAAVPALHLVGHEDDHVHIDGAIVPLDADRAPGPHALDPTAPGPHALDPTAPDPHAPAPAPKAPHGSGSLAHFAAASLEPPTVDLAPLEQVVELDGEHPPLSSHTHVPSPRARAPPVR
jgi:hypothetical protein